TNGWDNALLQLGIPLEKRSQFFEVWNRYADRLCIDLDVETLRPVLHDTFNLDLPPDFSLLELFADNFKQNTAIWPVIEEAKHHVPVGLLTNMYIGMFNA